MASRPRLRSTAGCLTCRKRRKKCDEKTPRCGNCSRLGFLCAWPQGRHGADESPACDPSTPSDLCPLDICHVPVLGPQAPLRGHAGPSPLRVAPSYRPFPSRSAREHDMFRYYLECYVPMLVRSSAHSGYFDYMHGLHLTTMNQPWMMDTYLGLAALGLSRGDERAQMIATRYYSSAIYGYRRAIEGGKLEGTEDWLIGTSLFFCLFEQWRSGPSCSTLDHLKGVAEMTRMRQAKHQGRVPSTIFSAAAERLAVESFTYHTAMVSLFSDNIESLSRSIVWTAIDTVLQKPAFPGASADANSPIIGFTPNIYRLAFQVTLLARSKPHKDHIDARQCMLQLNDLKTAGLVSSNRAQAGMADLADLLVIVLEIFITKLLWPEIESRNSSIGLLVERAVSILSGTSVNFCLPCSSALCWAIAILTCATESAEHAMLFKDVLTKLWGLSFSGHVLRSRSVVENIWEWRTQQGISSYAPGPHAATDGLRLLTSKDGLYGFLDKRGAPPRRGEI